MPPLSNALKVLIIDDDERALETYRAALHLEGYEVVTAMNAVDGARQLTKSHPDAVLLDLHMQEVSEGLAFLRRLRSIDAYQTTPVAIITGDYAVDSAVESDLREYGATITLRAAGPGDHDRRSTAPSPFKAYGRARVDPATRLF